MSTCTHCGANLPAGSAVCPTCGAAVPKRSAVSKGLLVVLGCGVLPGMLALLGIAAAIFVPNFLDALQHTKQKRAAADLRKMGVAIEAYRAAHQGLPEAVDVDSLARLLGEAAVVRLDPWKHPYRYACWPDDPEMHGCSHYRIASAGSDGKFSDPELRAYDGPEYTCAGYTCDIVYGDGRFVTAAGAH
jgi:hypothetical protein